jgi:hypothetical protein
MLSSSLEYSSRTSCSRGVTRGWAEVPRGREGGFGVGVCVDIFVSGRLRCAVDVQTRRGELDMLVCEGNLS